MFSTVTLILLFTPFSTGCSALSLSHLLMLQELLLQYMPRLLLRCVPLCLCADLAAGME